jgi:pimeloyl-ACP methyl ester carboxylesterase
MPKILVDENRVELFFEVSGNGPQRVLFLMGLATSFRSWRNQMNFFAKLPEYTCCVVENRGVGRSSSPVGLYSSKRLALDVLELLNHLGWDRFHLVGLSMGGMIALELSFLVLERLQSLSLLVTHSGGVTGIVPLMTVGYVMRNWRPYRDHDEWTEFLIPLLYSKKWLAKKYVDDSGLVSPSLTNHDVARAELIQIRQDEGVESVAGVLGQIGACLRHYISFARLQILRESGVPTMIMTGDKDKLVRFQNSFILRDALQPRKFVLLNGAGHMIHEECAQKVNESLFSHFENSKSYQSKSARLYGRSKL